MHGAFDVPEAEKIKIEGRALVLIDDVLTSGRDAQRCGAGAFAGGCRPRRCARLRPGCDGRVNAHIYGRITGSGSARRLRRKQGPEGNVNVHASRNHDLYDKHLPLLPRR